MEAACREKACVFHWSTEDQNQTRSELIESAQQQERPSCSSRICTSLWREINNKALFPENTLQVNFLLGQKHTSRRANSRIFMCQQYSQIFSCVSVDGSRPGFTFKLRLTGEAVKKFWFFYWTCINAIN